MVEFSNKRKKIEGLNLCYLLESSNQYVDILNGQIYFLASEYRDLL